MVIMFSLLSKLSDAAYPREGTVTGRFIVFFQP